MDGEGDTQSVLHLSLLSQQSQHHHFSFSKCRIRLLHPFYHHFFTFFLAKVFSDDMVSSDYPRHDGSAAEVVTTLSEPHSPADSLFDDYSDDESESPPSAPTSAVTNRPQTPAAVVLAVPSQQTSPIPLPAPRFTFEPPTPAIPEPQAPSPSTAPLVPPDKRKRKAVDATPPTTAALSPSRPQKVTRVLDVTDDAMAATSTQVVRTAATHTPASVVPSGPVGVSPMRGRSVVYHPQAPPPDFNEMLAIIEVSRPKERPDASVPEVPLQRRSPRVGSITSSSPILQCRTGS